MQPAPDEVEHDMDHSLQGHIERQPAGQLELARLSRQFAVRLTTYKRDGTPVGTAVNIAVEGDHAYFRSYAQSWKARRLRHNPEVEVAPSTFYGRASGPALHGRVRLLDGEEGDHAACLIERKHPIFQRVLVRLAHRVMHYTTLHYEVRLADG